MGKKGPEIDWVDITERIEWLENEKPASGSNEWMDDELVEYFWHGDVLVEVYKADGKPGT